MATTELHPPPLIGLEVPLPGGPHRPHSHRCGPCLGLPAGVPPARRPGRASQSPASLAPGRWRPPAGAGLAWLLAAQGYPGADTCGFCRSHDFFVNCPAGRACPPALYPPLPSGHQGPWLPSPSPRGQPAPPSGVPVWAASPNLNFPSGGGARPSHVDLPASGPDSSNAGCSPSGLRVPPAPQRSNLLAAHLVTTRPSCGPGIKGEPPPFGPPSLHAHALGPRGKRRAPSPGANEVLSWAA